MIARNKKTIKKFMLWIFIAVLAMTVFLGVSIYFSDDTGDIYYQGFFSSLKIATLISGLIAVITLKKYVARGMSRKTFFKDSTLSIVMISLYSLLLINVFGWILNKVPALAGQILTSEYIENMILLNASAFVAALLFYYVGLTIYFSFRINGWFGTLVSIVLGGFTGYMSFTDMLLNNPGLYFLSAGAAALIFGYLAFRTVTAAYIKI
ncbi:hypothetical protein GCM10007275_19050 [Jeotgalicoccus coquinae]|uniref:Uncharacterized protein n=1 Tax=Jeotgalicoccus coquinae TaxID=709509 RepID=A0A6V7RRT5_9STAP|nr:hypothetical protein [Jeotgalicoccus coquinae]MBB6423894.1 hypothetical protein [Jeotgalicoccus coquinae]GGE24158.1 hypothetical protein GCM10007275_19050 [Jeotgalicoccus coquinae]CAD2080564.1 hypothetical protein JEOCOQ751_01772 [Jeotgalicoccus coquinae]